MKLLQMFYVDDKFVHPLYAKYVGGVTMVGKRAATPSSLGKRGVGRGDEDIIDEFMDQQIGDDTPAPLSQDYFEEEGYGDDDNEIEEEEEHHARNDDSDADHHGEENESTGNEEEDEQQEEDGEFD